MIASLDPGINGCGLGLLDAAGRLHVARFLKNRVKAKAPLADRIKGMVQECADSLTEYELQLHTICAEWMQHYGLGQSKGDPANLAKLHGVVGGFICYMQVPANHLYLPHEWKGSIKKEAMICRIREALTKDEFSRIEFPQNTCTACRTFGGMFDPCEKKTSCLAHNIFDGIGIGLYFVGRLTQTRIIHR